MLHEKRFPAAGVSLHQNELRILTCRKVLNPFLIFLRLVYSFVAFPADDFVSLDLNIEFMKKCKPVNQLLRVSELRYFTVEAIRYGEVTVDCKSKTRTILVPGKLKNILLNYAKRHGIASGAIFVTRNGKPLNRSNIWAAMKKLCESAGVKPPKVFPHNLRKLFARTFYGIEKDIAKLADILGHSSINTTRIYIMTTGQEHRRKIERLGLVM